MQARGTTLWISLAVLALTPRVLEVLTESAYVHPDALHQGLEPAFRIVHGFGQQSWEWSEGVRSFAWPGLLALAFGSAKALGWSGAGQGMAFAVALARIMVAVIDVIGVLLAARLASRVCGRWGAIMTVVALSIHPAPVVMGAQPLIDVPAATALVWACERALVTDHFDRRRALWFGVASGLTLALRVQLFPALIVLWLVVGWRERGRPEPWSRIGVGFALVVLASGLLDWATWGSPFHSTIAYLRFNLDAGRTAMGVMPADRYWSHFWLATDAVAPLLLLLGIWGAVRQPALALVLLAVLLSHQLVPYKVWRFLHPAMGLLFVLAVTGAAAVVERMRGRDHRLAMGAAGLMGAWLVLGSIRASLGEGIWETTWLYNQGGMPAVQASRGLNRAYLELGRRERVGGVVQAVLPSAAAPGLALLGHDVAISHPLGGLVPPHELEAAQVWIVQEQNGRGPLDPSRREWVDAETGVAIHRAVPRAGAAQKPNR